LIETILLYQTNEQSISLA